MQNRIFICYYIMVMSNWIQAEIVFQPLPNAEWSAFMASSEIVLLVFPRRGEIFQDIINKIDCSCFNMKQDESSGLVWISLLPVAWSFGARPFIHLEDTQLIGKAPARRCSSPPALCWNKISLHNWLHYLLMLWNHPEAFIIIIIIIIVIIISSPPSSSQSFYESNFCLLLFPWKPQDCASVSRSGLLWLTCFSLQGNPRKLILLDREKK